MVRHFSRNNLNFIKNKKPDFLYFCPLSGKGPSGLMLAVYDTNNFFVANYSRNKEEGYSDLLNEILECVPEFQLITKICKSSNKREKFDGLDYIYFGYGNVALMQPKIYVKNEINNFFSFKNYLAKLNKINLYKLSENDMTWRCRK